MELKAFESQRRGTRGKQGSSVDDEVLHCITCNDHDTLLMVNQAGIVRGLKAYEVPTASLRAKGAPIPSVLNSKIGESVTAVLAVSKFTDDEYLVLATKQGIIKKTPLKVLEKVTSRGLVMAKLFEGDQLGWCHKCTEEDDILIGTSKGKAARFNASVLRPSSRTARGVKAIDLNPGDTLASMNILEGGESDRKKYVLIITEQGIGKRVLTDEFKVMARGRKGIISIKFKDDSQDKVQGFLIVNEEDEILLTSAKGVMVRQRVSEINIFGCYARGSVVQKLNEDDRITSISIVPERAKK